MAETHEYILGMDCGTTNLKAVLLRNDGVVVAMASRPNTFLQPGPNMQEQDAEEWWNNACAVFREITGQMEAQELLKIRGICVSSHTVSLLPVDADGMPLRHAITYQDGRSVQELEEILEKVGRQRFVQIAGGQPSVAFLPGKLLWYQRHEPELYAKTAYILQASSFLNFRLTGVMSLDIDQALRTQCMDAQALVWSQEIAAAAAMDFTGKMPPVYQVDDLIGRVTEEAAAQTSLPPGIQVLAGCSDAMASMYATGIHGLDEAGESSGTTSLVFVGSAVRSRPDVPITTRPCSIDGMPWLFDAPIQASGASLRWFLDTFGAQEKDYAREHGLNIYDYLNEMAAQAAPGARGLFFFPYLMGERAPLWNDHATGMWIGMRMDMERCEFIRSVFEGTAFALRNVMETVKESGANPKCLRICGGGSASRTWNKIKASMLHMPVHVLQEDSGNVPVGDALLAGYRLKVFPDLSRAVRQVVQVKEVVEPDPAWEKVYDQLYPYYVGMYQALDPQLKSLHAMLAHPEFSI